MEDIKEDYCSVKVKQLLEEKGFIVKYYYAQNDYRCPTHQLAMKWLREKGHNIVLGMLPRGDDSFVLWTYNVLSNKNSSIIWGNKQPKYNTYEEAAEAAIKYVLENLI